MRRVSTARVIQSWPDNGPPSCVEQTIRIYLERADWLVTDKQIINQVVDIWREHQEQLGLFRGEDGELYQRRIGINGWTNEAVQVNRRSQVVDLLIRSSILFVKEKKQSGKSDNIVTIQSRLPGDLQMILARHMQNRIGGFRLLYFT